MILHKYLQAAKVISGTRSNDVGEANNMNKTTVSPSC
ncbi:hypothetical protein CI610_03717 [invertebrate metagenome]|uniref:Uncharacterized protein n=1 Tax=invertebrate metagenome TaxID=1711999 RepID=A0A2H9T2B3_9ZZZZ